jgi:excisionase family DNA binding protein
MNLTLVEAAQRAGCSPGRLRKLAKAGEVPAARIGRPWIFPENLLQGWIDERCLSNRTRKA